MAVLHGMTAVMKGSYLSLPDYWKRRHEQDKPSSFFSLRRRRQF